MELTPSRLLRLLALLEVSKVLVLDAVRGRPIRRQDVSALRGTLVGLRRVLDALDDARPWDLEEDT